MLVIISQFFVATIAWTNIVEKKINSQTANFDIGKVEMYAKIIFVLEN